jgi:hypothetical protein
MVQSQWNFTSTLAVLESHPEIRESRRQPDFIAIQLTHKMFDGSTMQVYRVFDNQELIGAGRCSVRIEVAMQIAQMIVAFVFGVAFVVTLLIIAIRFPNPTPFQYKVFQTVLALAAAGVAAMVPGFIDINLKLSEEILIRAGGALAVFVIVFFLKPARLVAPMATHKDVSDSERKPSKKGNG